MPIWVNRTNEIQRLDNSRISLGYYKLVPFIPYYYKIQHITAMENRYPAAYTRKYSKQERASCPVAYKITTVSWDDFVRTETYKTLKFIRRRGVLANCFTESHPLSHQSMLSSANS